MKWQDGVLTHELERTSEAAAVSEIGQGGRAIPAPSPKQTSGVEGAEPPGGDVVGSPTSVHTCDQVHKKEGQGEVRDEVREEYRDALVEALIACGRGCEADAVAKCGRDFKVGKCLDCAATPAFPVSCGHRLCPFCAARRAEILLREHEDKLRQIRQPKMLTLTFLSVEHLDRDYIKWARNCFTKLRRRKVMEHCWGGIYSFEATHTKNGWHLHIHALVASGYLPQKDLSREWEAISGAKVVDIRILQGVEKYDAIREVVKYPAKASTFIGEPKLVDEFLDATRGVNLAYGFGDLYRVKTKRSGSGRMMCPLCGGENVAFDGQFGFCVPRELVVRVRHGYIWRPPPSPAEQLRKEIDDFLKEMELEGLC